MTQTELAAPTCSECKDEPAVHAVSAQHLDPDDDGTGRSVGWSRVMTDHLCDDCLKRWEDNDCIAITEVS